MWELNYIYQREVIVLYTWVQKRNYYINKRVLPINTRRKSKENGEFGVQKIELRWESIRQQELQWRGHHGFTSATEFKIRTLEWSVDYDSPPVRT